MNKFAAAVKAQPHLEKTLTENMAVTNSTTMNPLVDLFFVAGACRGRDISTQFARAFAYDANIATRILLWVRDARGGAGERQTFRNLVNKLDIETQKRIITKVPELGRWDDMFAFTDPFVRSLAFNAIREALVNGNALCAKWMPRKGPIATELRKFLGMSPKQYRKTLVNATKVVESQMCAKEWDKIVYPHVPSVAMSRYMKAFSKHDLVRFGEYLESVRDGKEKMNTSVVFPHDVIRVLRYGNQVSGADTMWNQLPDYVPEGASFLPVVDVSGSMVTKVSGSVDALDISVGLGLYLSERNKSAFKDIFVTFSGNPKLERVSGTLSQRMEQMERSEWEMNTNLEAAFGEILRHAIQNRVPFEDMPQVLLILSDMEFDYCIRNSEETLYENMKVQYENAGYQIPRVVFWNLFARNAKNFPITIKNSNTAAISGYSPTLIKQVLGNKLEPLQVVLDTVNIPRYDF